MLIKNAWNFCMLKLNVKCCFVHDPLTFSLRGWQVLQWKMISLATFGSTLTQLQWYQASQPSQQTQDTLPSGLLQPLGPSAQALTFEVLFVLLFVASFEPLFAFPWTIFECWRCFHLDIEANYVNHGIYKLFFETWNCQLDNSKSLWVTFWAVISQWKWHKSNLNRSGELIKYQT